MVTPSLATFARNTRSSERPPWMFGPSLPAERLGGTKLEQVLDTLTALQRADWLEDGVYVGPGALDGTYRDLLTCARTLEVAVPPAIAAGAPMDRQGVYGTDGRAFLYLSTYLLHGIPSASARFLLGRLLGKIAARQVTVTTVYGLLAGRAGLREAARRSLGPVVDVLLAPLSLGVRLTLSRWHRAAELSADRAGLLCCRDLDAAGLALLKQVLGVTPTLSRQTYLRQLHRSVGRSSPGRWAELLSDKPWTHKRLLALELFASSALYARLTGAEPGPDAVDDERLEARTRLLLGVR